MKSVNNELKSLNAEMNASSAAFKGQEGSVSALRDKQRILSSEIDQQKEKVAALSAMHDKAVSAYGADSAAADKYRQQLLNAQAALSKMERAQEETSAKLSAARSPINRAKAAYQNLKKGLEDLRKKYPALDHAIKGTEAVLKGSAKTIAGLTAAGAAAAAGMTILAVKGFKQLSKYAIDAAKDGNPAFAGLAENLTRLDAASTAAEAALGSLVGPMLEKLSGQGADLLNKFSEDLTAANGDPDAIASALSGLISDGASMLKEDLPELSGLASGLISGLAGGISEASPELVDAGVEVVTALLDSIIANAPTIASAGTDLITQLLFALITAAPDLLGAGLEIVTTLLEGIADNSEDIGQSAVELVTALVVGIVEHAPDLIVAAVSLVAGLLSGLWNGLGELAAPAVAWVQEVKAQVVAKATELIEGGKELINNVINGFLDGLAAAYGLGQSVVEQIKSGIQAAWEGVKEWFSGLWNSVFGNLHANVSVGTSGGVNGSHANGLSYVPYDGYIAELHRGERVLTAAEAADYRTGRGSGGVNIGQVVINNKNDVDYFLAQVDKHFGG